MRAYNLVISDPDSGLVWQPTTTGLSLIKTSGGSTFTSHPNGITQPPLAGALNVEFDLPVYPFATPQGQAIIRVWGVGLPMLGQAAQLAGQNFKLYAGMGKGLPLANPAQYGLVAQGQVYQAFGNWQGTNQTLDLVCYPATNMTIGWNWPKGTPLSTALQTVLYQAFPGYQVNLNISSALVLPYDDKGIYPSLATFAGHLQELTQPLGETLYPGTAYQGVNITLNGTTINVYDGQGPTPLLEIELAFQDLIGQPTWIGVNTVNLKTVLRTDISVGSMIKFPVGITAPFALTVAAAASPNAPAASKTAFQGSFLVTEAHYFGNFRQPDAESWNTTYNAVGVPS